MASTLALGMPNCPVVDVDDYFLSEKTLALISDLDPDFTVCRLNVTERDKQITIVNCPDMVRDILVSQHRKFKKGPEFSRIKILTGGGLIVSDGVKWRTGRRLVQPAFIRTNWDILQEASDHHAKILHDRWMGLAARNAEVDITDEAERYAMGVMISSIFGKDAERFYTSDTETIFDALKNGNVKNIEVVPSIRSARQVVLSVLEQRKKITTPQRDILGLLLEARDRTSPDFSDKEIVDEIITLIVAGYETSAILLAWVFYSLGVNPAARRYLGCGKAALSDRIENLANECLRLYPPVWMFSRRALEDVDLGSLQVSKGDVVAISPFLLHRRPSDWSVPLSFQPDRFENVDPHRNSYVPFSAGPRRCIGDVLSNYEMQTVVGRIAPDIRFTVTSPHHIDFEPLINLRSKHAIMAKLSLNGLNDV
ncbi:MAG: cytochrome P450 [Sulfitobacter sp.]